MGLPDRLRGLHFKLERNAKFGPGISLAFRFPWEGLVMSASRGTPAVALESLSIQDFRGIERLDLHFRGPDGLPNRLVVLAGPNGSGKTAVLEAALIVSGGYQLAVGRRGKKAIRQGAKDYLIQGNFKAKFGFLDEPYTSKDSARSEPPKPDPPIPHWYFSSWRSPMLVGSVDVTIGKRGRPRAKTDKNRLWNVKKQLANGAAIEQFPGRRQSDGLSYEKIIRSINESWRDFYPESMPSSLSA